MKQILFLSVLLLIIFTACNDDSTPECTTNNSGIYGSWDWIQSTYYFTANGPEIRNPSTEGYTRKIELNTNNQAFFYKNGALEDSTTYQIINNEISFNNGGTYYYSEDSCIFILDQTFIDGPKEEYECTCE